MLLKTCEQRMFFGPCWVSVWGRMRSRPVLYSLSMELGVLTRKPLTTFNGVVTFVNLFLHFIIPGKRVGNDTHPKLVNRRKM